MAIARKQKDKKMGDCRKNKGTKGEGTRGKKAVKPVKKVR